MGDMTMKKWLWCLALVLLAATGTAFAQDAAEEEPAPEPLWKGSLGLAYLGTTGNSETSSFGLDFATERRPTPWGLTITGKFNRNDENGVLTAERYFLGARARRAFGERLELFGGLSAEQDEFAGYNLLFLAETGVTYKALIGPKHFLALDAGVTWTDEDRVEPEPDVNYMGALLGLSYEWKLSDSSSLTEQLKFYPNFDDSSNWRLSSMTGLQTAVNSWLAIKLGYEIRYRNQPIDDNEDTDTTSSASVVFTF
jgi:putative salt-induced outer membrane protein